MCEQLRILQSRQVSSATVTENQPRDTCDTSKIYVPGRSPNQGGGMRVECNEGEEADPGDPGLSPALPLRTSLLDHVDSTPT